MPERGDIPAKIWRIHPRPKAVAFCRRGKGVLARWELSNSINFVPKLTLPLNVIPNFPGQESSNLAQDGRALFAIESLDIVLFYGILALSFDKTCFTIFCWFLRKLRNYQNALPFLIG
jgi:hypothetical protein